MSKEIRVRIAPSPSGFLHVGTARTGLFNYLFAKKNNGKFILRIEDTDLERSDDKYTQNIFDSLKAMNINWDEGPDVGGEYGPYKQSERFDLYKQYAETLLESGHAYYCYCTQEELESEKNKAQEEKRPNKYSKRCQNLTDEQIQSFKAEGRVPTLRFSMPDKIMKFKDLVKGELEFDTALIGDFVIMKSNGTPTYNFAVVIDDMLMKMSHIIRGEDHISNTPRQLAIYEALNAEIPEFAHVGMILAPDRSKLSKRHGATAVSEFIEQGYIPEAFVNFISLLGWSPADGEEIKASQELINAFELERVSPSPAIFEMDKLNWMNGQYIRKMPIAELVKLVKPYLTSYSLEEYSQEKLERIVDAVKEPLVTLNEITESVSYFFGNDVVIDEKIQADVLDLEESQIVLKEFAKLNLSYDNMDELHNQLGDFRKQMKADNNLKPKQTMWAIRAAVTGRVQGADIAEVISILGSEKVDLRVSKAIK